MRTLLALGMIILFPCLLFANPSHMAKEALTPIGHAISGEEIYVNSLKISPDFQHIGYVSRIGRTFRVWLDGVSKLTHSGVTRQSPFFSPRQNRLAYVAQDKDRMCVVIDGHEQSLYKQVGSITFSPDGFRLAYRAEDGKGRQMVVVDGKPGPEFDVGVTHEVGIVFSPDSKHVAYAGINKNNSYIFVLDDKKMRRFEKIGQIKFSPDSRHYAYFAMKKGKWQTVLDDKKGSEYTGVSNLFFSADSNQLAYMAQKNRRPIIVKNNQEITDGRGVFFPTFSPVKSRFAYLVADKANKFQYVIDGNREMLVDKPGRLIFSHDDSATAYAAFIDGKWSIIKNGVKGPGFKKIFAFSFSPTTNDIVYAADNEEGKTCVVSNTVPGKFYDSIGIPVYSPDGGKIAYVARRSEKEMFMVVNSIELKPYPIIGLPATDENGKPGFGAQKPFFSPKGNRMAYPVFDPDKKKAFMVVDGKTQSDFEAVMEPCFSPDEKHVGYMGKMDDGWHLVVDGKPGRNSCEGIIRGATIAYSSVQKCFYILVANETESGLAFYRLEAEVNDPS